MAFILSIAGGFIVAGIIGFVGFGIGINNPQYREQPGASLAIDPEAVQAIRQMLGQFRQISVRDDLSKTILQPLTKTEITVVPDPALFLAPPPTASARPKTRPDRVGINFALHSSIAEALLRANFRIYVEALKTYQAETGCHYIYFVHSDSEHKIAAMLTAEGVRLQAMTRHLLGLFAGRPGARAFRRHLAVEAPRPGAGLETLRAAVAHVTRVGMLEEAA